MRNEVTVAGHNLFREYCLILLDGWDLGTPAAKTLTVDIPFRDGLLDLTEHMGEVMYAMREQTFTFLLPDADDRKAREVHGKVCALCNGRRVRYSLGAADTNGTWTGRWNVGYPVRASEGGRAWTFECTVSADPYRTVRSVSGRYDAFDGVTIPIRPGAKPVNPTIEVMTRAEVSWGKQTWVLEAGSWNIRDLRVTGDDTIYVRTGTATGSMTWEDVKAKRWGEVSTKRWSDLIGAGGREPGTDYRVYVKYDVLDF